MPNVSPRAQKTGFQTVPEDFPDALEWCRLISRAVRGLLAGKMNVNTTLTLTASATSTTVSDERIGGNTVLHLMPMTANAATALANVRQTFPNTTAGQAILTHSNTADVDKTFAVSFIG